MNNAKSERDRCQILSQEICTLILEGHLDPNVFLAVFRMTNESAYEQFLPYLREQQLAKDNVEGSVRGWG